MIHWLVQSVHDHPDLERGVAPEGLLNPTEQARLDELHYAKRRRDWLMGRWTAKKLLQSYIEQQTGICPPLTAMTIANDPDGAPYATLSAGWSQATNTGGPYRELWARPTTVSLSISHCDNHAFCAICVEPGVHVGVDIEKVEPRSWTFVKEYFTNAEIDQVCSAPPDEQDRLITVIWSAKEAALKALRLGLTVDTRWVSCHITATVDIQNWTAIDVQYTPQPRRVTIPASPQAAPAKTFAYPTAPISLFGWWRMMEQYALTMVVKREQ